MTNITVLLVEEQKQSRIRLKNILEQAPQISILGEASQGQEALELIEQTQPHLVIVDLDLPDMSGVQLTQMIKQSPLTELTKVLILTQRQEGETILAALGAGADSYLLKNYNLAYLPLAIKETYQGNSWLDPQITKFILKQVRSSPKTTAKSLKKFTNLTDRELQVLQLIVHGCNNALISEKLFITIGTVKTHVRSILSKLAVQDRTQAAVIALRNGLVD